MKTDIKMLILEPVEECTNKSHNSDHQFNPLMVRHLLLAVY